MPWSDSTLGRGLHAHKHARHMLAAIGKLAILLLQSTYALYGSAWRKTSTE